MFYDTEYPQVYSRSGINLDIFNKPIIWFKPFLTSFGQLILYRWKIKPIETQTANTMMAKKIIKMKDGTEIKLGISTTSSSPRAVVIYLHTICGNYTQLAHIAHMLKDDNIAYVTYTRSGNDNTLNFSTFNFVGRIEELQTVINYIHSQFPNAPIHAIGASAGSALLIRYLGQHNKNKYIKSAVLVSPGYSFVKSLKTMNRVSKAYLVNKMKYMIRKKLDRKDELQSIRSLDDWVEFQSKLLGYNSKSEYELDCDPVHYLHKINVPSLFISSLDDDIFHGDITQEYLGLPNINPNITIITTKRGGHVIFEDEGHDLPWFFRVIHEWVKNRIGY